MIMKTPFISTKNKCSTPPHKQKGILGITPTLGNSKMAYTITNRATELIKELKRSDWVPKYNVLTSDWTDGQEEGINAVLDEMDDTMEKIVAIYVGMEEVTGEMPESEEGQVDELHFWNVHSDGVEKKNKLSADITQF